MVMWLHLCGWTGDESQLKSLVHDGIEYGLACPKCGDDWPFGDDEWADGPDADELHDWEPSNRVKSQSADKSKFWCSKCDAAIVGRVGKCPNCGHIEDKKRKRGIAT